MFSINTCIATPLKLKISSKNRFSRLSVVMTSSKNDLAIFGPGVLGSVLGYNWLQKHEGACVLGVTKTDTNHHKLKNIGLQPVVNNELTDQKFPNIVFCAPPSGNEDYTGEVQRACELWDESGTLIFTSSVGVFRDTEGKIDENSPVLEVGQNARQDKLLLAEQTVMKAGGNVLRLTGLYHGWRGAHTYFIKQGQVERSAARVVNLIHYEDAVDMVMQILQHKGQEGPFRSTLFLGCDNHPITFQDMMQACYDSGIFGDKRVEFIGPQQTTDTKTLNNDISRERLSWKPKYDSFVSFMQQGGEDVYTNQFEQFSGKI